VPAGTYCKFAGEVTGNVTVEGTLKAFGSTFDGNVTVTGGHFQTANQGSTIGDIGSGTMELFGMVCAVDAPFTARVLLHGTVGLSRSQRETRKRSPGPARHPEGFAP
jgi:cytoskeletal protein CcmA (bactofilin family)